jgi:hypothetical protein
MQAKNKERRDDTARQQPRRPDPRPSQPIQPRNLRPTRLLEEKK